MSLVSLWRSDQTALGQKKLQQIIAIAGDGRLRDGNATSTELRELLAIAPSSLLTKYAEECLATAFADSGLALQDIINEVGRRLGFSVEAGRYRGTTGRVGCDGLWRLPDGRALVIEVKTTDAYRIDLEVLAGYRAALLNEGRVADGQSSVLIVVGRDDTGDLEAQVRGSRHAWDMRMISAGALLRLLATKEVLERPAAIARMHDLLFPLEFTKLDALIDVVFTTAEDIQEDVPERESESTRGNHATARPSQFHEQVVKRVEAALQMSLIRLSRTAYQSPDKSLAVVSFVSKDYGRMGGRWYWYAIREHQKTFFDGAKKGLAVFGCGEPSRILMVSWETLCPWMDEMRQTETPTATYWHMEIHEVGGRYRLVRRKGAPEIDLTPYLLREK